MSTPEQPRPTSPPTSKQTPTSAPTQAPTTERTSTRPAAISTPSKKTPSRPADRRPALSENGVPLARVRRAPRVFPFVLTGAVLGAILGLVIAYGGGDGGNYTESSSVAYLLVLCAALGAMLGGVAFAIADKRS